jgi:hypothetical protein
MAIVEGDSMLARVVFVMLALGASAVSFGRWIFWRGWQHWCRRRECT